MKSGAKETFDAGELWSWKVGVSPEDYKNTIIDAKSVDFLIKTIEHKLYFQRFAIYGKIEKIPGKASVHHIFIQPSLPSWSNKEDIAKLEKIFGQGTIVIADGKLSGIVHNQTKALRLEEAIIKEDKHIQLLIKSQSGFETALSCTYTMNGFEMLNRGAWNKSVRDLIQQSVFIFPIPDQETVAEYYDPEMNQFIFPKIFTEEYHLRRSSSREVLEAVSDAITKAINENLDKHLSSLKSRKHWGFIENKTEIGNASTCFSFYYQDKWNKDLRYSKDNLSMQILETMYIAASLKDVKPGDSWPKDQEIIFNCLEFADKKGLALDLEMIPTKFQHLNPSITLAMFSARKFPVEVMKELIERGVDITLEDDEGHNLLWYAKDNEPTYLYLKAIFELNEAIENENIDIIKYHLEKKYIDITKPLYKGEPLLFRLANMKCPQALEILINEMKLGIEKPRINFDVDFLNDFGETALFFAAQQGWRHVMLLLNAGADPGYVLHHADYSHLEISDEVKKQLEKFNDAKLIKNDLKKFVLKIAKFNKIPQIDKLILQSKMILESKASTSKDYHKAIIKVWNSLQDIINSSKEKIDSSSRLFASPPVPEKELRTAIEEIGHDYGLLTLADESFTRTLEQ